MNRLCIIALTSLLSASANAQQDLRDPRYIYRQDKGIVKYGFYGPPYNPSRPHNYDIAILYKGTLYKGLDFYEFFANQDLMYYEGKHYNKARKIAKYTNDQSIKKLYVVGKALSPKKAQKMRSFFSKVYEHN